MSPQSKEGKPLQLLAPAEGTVADVTEFCRDDNFLQHNTIKEGFFSNLYEAWWKPYALQRYTVGKGGREQGCDLCAHEVDFH